ncbi:MAG: glycosyltransferase family 39 protein [Ancrocorticia sp.]|uniref:glycosyltransferase family 39 protein n=1 Tax=Ancrocorticia sp. TaxID=2593684 RepID=UPI003F90628B
MARSLNRSRWTLIGLAGACGAFLAIALISALGTGWSGTNDSVFHLDYIYQVANGNLPEPEGVEFNPLVGGSSGGRQFASAHPPLFYALSAVIAGDSLTFAGWENAVLRVRLLNVVFGLATVLAVAWVARLSSRSNRASFVVAVAATAPLLTSFVLFSGDIYNDVLLTLLATLAIGCTIKCLRDGPSWPLIIATSAIGAAGMLTKATFIIVLAIAIGGLMVASFTDQTPKLSWPKRTGAIVAKLGTLIVVPLLASAWFYARNIELSGSWMRSSPKAPLLGRPEKSMMDVLGDKDFYEVYFEQVLGSTKISFLGLSNHTVSLVLSGVALILLLVWAVRKTPRWRHDVTVNWVFIRLAPVGVLMGCYAAQLSQATGFGQINIRYLFPALIVLGLIFGGAATTLGRVSGTATAAISLIMGLAALNYLGWLATNRPPGVGLLDRVRSIGGQMVAHGLPLASFHILLVIFGLSCVIVGLAITKLQRIEERASASSH